MGRLNVLTTISGAVMPPGAVALRSDREQWLVATDATRLAAELAVSDEFAEDCRSLSESADFVVRHWEHGTPVTCECCGTEVAAMPAAAADQYPRTWKPGIWETSSLRRHTLRRCNWKRAEWERSW